ncbi:hypothetical protein CSUI_008284, partial [Cystoisospora suis]
IHVSCEENVGCRADPRLEQEERGEQLCECKSLVTHVVACKQWRTRHLKDYTQAKGASYQKRFLFSSCQQ